MSQTTTMVTTEGQCSETLTQLGEGSRTDTVVFPNVKEDLLKWLQSASVSGKISDVTSLLEGAVDTILHFSRQIKRFFLRRLLRMVESILFYLIFGLLLVQFAFCVPFFFTQVPLWWDIFLFGSLAILMWMFSLGFHLKCTVVHERLKKEITGVDLLGL